MIIFCPQEFNPVGDISLPSPVYTIAISKMYDTFDFILFCPIENPRCDPRIFNNWKGFQAKIVPQDEIDMEKIQLILYHLKAVSCD